MDLDTLLSKLVDVWQAHEDYALGTVPRTPASATAIKQFEELHAIRFPKDFRRYLLTVNGMPENAYVGFLTVFDPLHEMKWSDEYKPSVDSTRYLIFVDHCIWSSTFSLGFRDGAFVGVYQGSGSPKYSSFTEFVVAYVTGADGMTPLFRD